MEVSAPVFFNAFDLLSIALEVGMVIDFHPVAKAFGKQDGMNSRILPKIIH